jgi:hypothetical protein
MTTEHLVDELLHEVASEALHARPTIALVNAPALFDAVVGRRRAVCTGGPLRAALQRLHRVAVNELDRVRRLFEELKTHHAQPHPIDAGENAEAAR